MKLFIQLASTAIAVVLLSLVFDITITPKYWGKEEMKHGDIVSVDTISLEVGDIVHYKIAPESMYHKGIKVEIGQEWLYPLSDPFKEPLIKIITDIKGDYIQFEWKTCRGIKNSFHKEIFFNKKSELLNTKNGYYTVRGEVRNINTKDIE